jgi:C-terminal processing protease CtpA/Prc
MMRNIQSSPDRVALNESLVGEILDKCVSLLQTRCIRLDGVAPNWAGLFAEERALIVQVASFADLESRVSAVLSRGGLSHVAFFHGTGQRAPARYAINATFTPLETASGSRWMFQDVHEGGPAYEAGIRPGDTLLSVSGRDVGPPTLPTFALGQDHALIIQRAAADPREVRVILPKASSGRKASSQPPMAEPASVTAREIAPGVVHLRVAFFPGVNGQRFARALDGALAAVLACERLIVDLRGNLGGFVGALRLMSYLTPGRVPVGYSLTRRGQDAGWRPESLPCIDRLPASKVDTLKMAVRFMVLHRDRSIRLQTEGLGPRSFHGRVVMLVNEHTLSAGEMVAAFAKDNRLAILVGTPTGGQVLGGANFAVGHGFTIRFPAAAWHTWRGITVEGAGVVPDVEQTLTLDSLSRGRDDQLEQAISVVERI